MSRTLLHRRSLLSLLSMIAFATNAVGQGVLVDVRTETHIRLPRPMPAAAPDSARPAASRRQLQDRLAGSERQAQRPDRPRAGVADVS